MNHGHLKTVTGTLLRNTIEQISIESGLEGNPFDFVLDRVKYLTKNTWIENTIRCCKNMASASNPDSKDYINGPAVTIC